jgi:hypothetical protein
MKKILYIIIFGLNFISSIVYAQGECTREFTVYLIEKGKILSKMPITYKDNNFYITNSKIPKDEFVFSYPIRYGEGNMYTLNDRLKLGSLTIKVKDNKKMPRKISTVSITEDKGISLDSSKFVNSSFDKKGYVFILGVKLLPEQGCKIEAKTEMHAGYIHEGVIKVTDTRRLRLIGNSITI